MNPVVYRMIIADDEPKIRNGLRKMLDYNQFGIEVVGEAEDGEIALREVMEKQPDILFLDICMPFINGLDLIHRLKENAQDCQIIIITGFDQFSYIQEAIKLQVFDYLLKPVTKSGLTETVCRVCDELNKRRNKDRYIKWVNERLDESIDNVREKFFRNLLKTVMDADQITSGLSFLNLKFAGQTGISALRVIKHSKFEKDSDNSLDYNLILFGTKNMVTELLGASSSICFYDDAGNIIIIGSTSGMAEWSKFCDKMNSCVEEYLNSTVICECEVMKTLTAIPAVYKEVCAKLKAKSSLKPITAYILQYMQSNYCDNNFSLETAAEKFKITPPYLSKLLKAETGTSFVDVLTNMRIQKAITMMNTSSLKIYEIAELTGYSNQYYFSRSFKKVTGLSPVQYKEGKSH